MEKKICCQLHYMASAREYWILAGEGSGRTLLVMRNRRQMIEVEQRDVVHKTSEK